MKIRVPKEVYMDHNIDFYHIADCPDCVNGIKETEGAKHLCPNCGGTGEIEVRK